MKPESIIDYPLWNKARWSDAAFLFSPGAAPGLGLTFEDITTAKKIFSAWRTALGEEDVEDIIRVSLATGTHPTRGDGYSIMLKANSDTVAIDSSITPIPHMFKAATGPNFMMKRFKEEFSRVGAYYIIPIPAVVKTGLDEFLPLAIIKRTLYQMDFSAIKPADEESVLLR